GALVAEIVLRRFETGPVGARLGAAGVDGDGLAAGAAAGLGQQLPDDRFRARVVALAEVGMPDAALGVDEVERRPIPVAERPPDRVVAVDGDRIADAQRRRRATDVVDVLLE